MEPTRLHSRKLSDHAGKDNQRYCRILLRICRRRNTYECRAKGIFRKDKFKPLVGDNVDITVLDEKELEGSVTEIHKRKNSLIRPAVANVDQALVIFAMDNPKPNFMLLDRFLIMMEREGVPAVICFNKKDLATMEELEFLCETYQSCGYQVILSSAEGGRSCRD